MASNNKNNFQWDASYKFDPVLVPDFWETVPYRPHTPQPRLFDDPIMIFNNDDGFANTEEVVSLVVQEEQGNKGGSNLKKNLPAPQSNDPIQPSNMKEPRIDVLESMVEDDRLQPNVEKDVPIQQPFVVIDIDDEGTEIQGEAASSSSTRKLPRKRGPITAKVINVSSVYFKLIKNNHDHHPNTHTLAMFDVGSEAEVEEVPSTRDEIRLIRPELLKNWRVETRERPGGSQDKFFSHPFYKRQFRSVVEVVKFIKTHNNLQGPDAHPPSMNGGKKRNIKKNRVEDKAKKLKTVQKTDLSFEEFWDNAHHIVLESSPTRGLANADRTNELSPELIAEMIDELINQ